MAVARSTISFTENNWQKLQNARKRSALVNKAIQYYFDANAFLKRKEEEFILEEFQHYLNTGEAYTFDETFE